MKSFLTGDSWSPKEAAAKEAAAKEAAAKEAAAKEAAAINLLKDTMGLIVRMMKRYEGVDNNKKKYFIALLSGDGVCKYNELIAVPTSNNAFDAAYNLNAISVITSSILGKIDLSSSSLNKKRIMPYAWTQGNSKSAAWVGRVVVNILSCITFAFLIRHVVNCCRGSGMKTKARKGVEYIKSQLTEVEKYVKSAKQDQSGGLNSTRPHRRYSCWF